MTHSPWWPSFRTSLSDYAGRTRRSYSDLSNTPDLKFLAKLQTHDDGFISTFETTYGFLHTFA